MVPAEVTVTVGTLSSALWEVWDSSCLAMHWQDGGYGLNIILELGEAGVEYSIVLTRLELEYYALEFFYLSVSSSKINTLSEVDPQYAHRPVIRCHRQLRALRTFRRL